jgi:hypothetical protein
MHATSGLNNFSEFAGRSLNSAQDEPGVGRGIAELGLSWRECFSGKGHR